MEKRKPIERGSAAVLEPESQTEPAAAPAPVLAANQKGEFVSRIPWKDTHPDVFVICCSDHRFEEQSRDLVHHLGFKYPHVVQIPSGVTMTLPLVSTFGFMSKAIDKISEGVIEMKRLEAVVLIAHRDCGAYKAAKHPLVGGVLKFAGKTVVELQHEHLAQAAKRMQMGIRGIKVRGFYADVVEQGGGKWVKFEEVKV